MREETIMMDVKGNELKVFRTEDNGADVICMIINNLAMIELDLVKNQLGELFEGQLITDTCQINRIFDIGTVTIKALFDNNTNVLNIKASDDLILDRDESFIFTTDMISTIQDLAK